MNLLTSTSVDNNVELVKNSVVIVIMKSIVASKSSISGHCITSLSTVHHSLIVTTRCTNSLGHMAKCAKDRLSILSSKSSTLTFCGARSCRGIRLGLPLLRRQDDRSCDASYHSIYWPVVPNRIRPKFDENQTSSSLDFDESRPLPLGIDPCLSCSGSIGTEIAVGANTHRVRNHLSMYTE